MEKLNIDRALDEIISGFGALDDRNNKLVQSSIRGFRRMRDIAVSEYPIAMTGLVSAEIGPQEHFCEALSVFLTRGREAAENSANLRAALVDRLSEGWADFDITNIVIGELFPGFTESAESDALPEGAYLASWLGIERPIEGFYLAFNIALDAE